MRPSAPIFCLLFALAATSELRSQTPVLSVYFESAADTLNARARAQIDSLSRAANAWGAYTLELRAYTDDIGTGEKNRILAANRAASVSARLLATAPQPTYKREQLVGEIALKPNTDAALQRAEARRVDLFVLRENPQTMQEFFELNSQRAKQHFELGDMKQATKFAGKKGTVLSIPAQAFERADGKKVAPALPISIELREAYTAGDMISQNLSTTSGGKLLQTGGSIYLEARDAGGNLLRLCSGKAIDISMPQQDKTLPADMQVFTAQRAGADNKSVIDWQATNRPFVAQPFVAAPQFRPAPLISTAGIKFPKTDNFNQTFFNNSLKKILPQPYALPTAPTLKAPVTPAYANPKIPLKEKFYKETLREKGEKKRNYKTRVEALYNAAFAQYQKEKNADTALRKAYNAEYNAFRQAARDYDFQCRRYRAYVDSLSTVMSLIDKYFYEPDFRRGRLTKDNPTVSLAENKQKIRRANQFIKEVTNFAPLQILGADSARADFADIIAAQNALNLRIDSFRLLCKGLPDSLLSAPTDTSYAEKIYQAALFSENRMVTENFSNEKLAHLHLNYTERIEQYLAQHLAYFMQADDINAAQRACDHLLSAGINDIFSQYEPLNAQYAELQRLYRQRKLEFAELGDKEMMRAIASTTTMGWINCDRFLQFPPQECTHFTLKHPTDEDTQFFVIIPFNRSIIALQAESADMYSCRQYQGLPKKAGAKLVGMRIKNGKYALSIQENTVENLLSAQPNFRECTPSEAIKSFAAL